MKKVLFLTVLFLSMPTLADDFNDDIDSAMLISCKSKNQFIMPDGKHQELCMQAINAKLQMQILEELQKLNSEKTVNNKQLNTH